jgi:hypothetical protein
MIKHPKILSKSFCKEMIENTSKYFTPAFRGTWKVWNVKDSESVKYILSEYSDIIPDGSKPLWINFIDYNVGVGLWEHKDVDGDVTFISALNDDFEGGVVAIDGTKISLKQGDVVAFDGTKLKHGVSEVTKGNRYSLSIWLKESKTELIKFKKTII